MQIVAADISKMFSCVPAINSRSNANCIFLVPAIGKLNGPFGAWEYEGKSTMV
jgi:hypothetical protein